MEKKHSHDGHRERLRDKFKGAGADALELHELLELYLFSALPRVNTNNIAHELIEKFGSLSSVFDAEVEELMLVKGIGETAALQIKLLPAIVRACGMEKYEGRPKFDTLAKAGEFGMRLFYGATSECSYALLLDNAMRKITCIQLSKGSVNSTVPDMRYFYQEVLNKNASAVILYHNHYKGLAIPSGSDLEFTNHLENGLSNINTVLIEHIVVGENNFNPIMKSQKGQYRAYVKGSNISSSTIYKFYNS